jgi:hypothetical protein
MLVLMLVLTSDLLLLRLLMLDESTCTDAWLRP